MEELIEQIWQQINDGWGDIRPVIEKSLPTDQMVMFNDLGELVEANRPMIESIICDKAERSKRLFFYLGAANIISLPEAEFSIKEREGGGREIHINSFSAMPMGTGGKEVVHRNSTSS